MAEAKTVAYVEHKRERTVKLQGNRRLWRNGALTIAAALLLQAAARFCPGFAAWYATAVYPVIVGTVGRLMGVFPVSVSELCLYLLAAAMVLYGALHIRSPLRILASGFCLLSALGLIYTVNCGINYYRKPFSSYTDLEIRSSSEEELYALCIYLIRQVDRECSALEQEAAGGAGEYRRQSVEDMKKLGCSYPQLSGYYPAPKPVLMSRLLSVQWLCGVYSPFTVEANYNRDMPEYNIPHTMCHELSHLKGFMREDEANFIGYLACTGSDSTWSRYSGYLTGWVYAGNALASADPNAYRELAKLLPQRAAADLREDHLFWKQYEGRAAEVSSQVNDAYLKINNQEDGVKSYGRMVDLMLAYYRQELKEKTASQPPA